jgi:hypothetical protein
MSIYTPKQPPQHFATNTASHVSPHAEHSIIIKVLQHMKNLYTDPKTRREAVLWLHGEGHHVVSADTVMQKLGIDRQEFMDHFPVGKS